MALFVFEMADSSSVRIEAAGKDDGWSTPPLGTAWMAADPPMGIHGQP